MLPDLLKIIHDFARGPSHALKRCQAALRTYEQRLAFFDDMLEFPPELGALVWADGDSDYSVLERSLLSQYFAECAKRYDRYGWEWCPENMHLHTNLMYEFHLTVMGHDDCVFTLCCFPVFGHLDDVISVL